MPDHELIKETLGGLLAGRPPITAVLPLTTGFSNDTFLLVGAHLILRMPPAAGAMLDGHDVVGQARIYQELERTPGAPPVPSVVHVEDDSAILGAPFYVMTRAAGEAVHDIDIQPWFADAPDAVRTKISHRWVSAFASLARLAPLAVLGEPVTPEDDLRKWQRFAVDAGCSVLAERIDRLLRIPAPRSGLPAVVHGDTKLSNLMWHNHELSAMLDWEMALNGEPLSDLGYMLYLFDGEYHGATRAPKLSGMLKREDVIALWSQVSGRSADGVFWHEIAQIAKITAIIAEGCNMYDSGRSSDPKLLYFKQHLDHYLGVIQAMLDGGRF